MGKQDIRSVELINWGGQSRVPVNPAQYSDYLAITYYDEILVHPVKGSDELPPLRNAYGKLQDIFGRADREHYESQQVIMAFTDICSGDKNGHTEDEIRDFWNDATSALFFMTMVNVSPMKCLDAEIKRIHTILAGEKGHYLLYLTFEYNEILVFFKGSSLQKYANLVMQCACAKENIGVLDTITVCCFNGGPGELEADNDMLCVQMGVRDHCAAQDYLKSRGIKPEALHWLLGRNDLGFIKENQGLHWLYDLCQDRKHGLPWLATTNFSILIPRQDSDQLTYKPEPRDDVLSLDDQINMVCDLYKNKCILLGKDPDGVFIRILKKTGGLMSNAWDGLLAGDLAICLHLELQDFLAYLEIILGDDRLLEQHMPFLRRCLDSFYQNVLTMVSSMVHSNQEFVQIPHSAPPVFFMLPKVMAYYSIIIRDIINVFRDSEHFYGVILSPKLVNELEVSSLAIRTLQRDDELLSVSIGEALLYDLPGTVATLGHEMAHFVGENTRNRTIRRHWILTYYTHGLLKEVISYGLRSIHGQEADIYPFIDEEKLADCANHMTSHLPDPLQDDPEADYMNRLHLQIDCLCDQILNNPERRGRIYSELFKPMLKETNVQSLLTPWLSSNSVNSKDRLIDVYAESNLQDVFENSVWFCKNRWSPRSVSDSFYEYVSYIFSEAYADMAMVMLFGMTFDDYLRVFQRGVERKIYRKDNYDDQTEMTRFMSVVRSACKINKLEGWSSDNMCPVCHIEAALWPDELRYVAGIIASDNSEAVAAYCNDNEIDIPLSTALSAYLQTCCVSLENHLNSSDRFATVEMLRKRYRSALKPENVIDQLKEMRMMESAYISSKLTKRPDAPQG